jgi:2-polyprenyl-3-methyl-5-hydroxy-6-metoxy-1,4-benzoquinol methylase
MDLLLKYKLEGSLLEIGCGKAGFLRLADQYFDVEGMDISQYAIQAIRPHFGDRVRVGNIEQHPLPAARYDVIAVFNILEHLRQPNQVIKRLSNALNPGGLVIGSVPNNQSLVGGLVTRIGNFFDRTHVSTFVPGVWQHLFAHAGFNSIDFFGEVTLGRNHCRYLRGQFWPHLSFNLMFICTR